MHGLLVRAAQQPPRLGVERKRIKRDASELSQKIPRKLPEGAKDSWRPPAQIGRRRNGAAQSLVAVLRIMVYTNRPCVNKRSSSRAAGLAVLGAAIACLVAAPASAAADESRVRSTDAGMLALFREGAERSATFSALVDRIGRSNGIVYVEFGYCAFGRVNGCVLPFIASAHGDRYLRILVSPDKHRRSHDQLLALIAHELRHALEVIEHPEVVDVTTMEALYRRIGTPETRGLTGYETSAARAAGDNTLSELRRQTGNTQTKRRAS
jgi:hypothetical protein